MPCSWIKFDDGTVAIVKHAASRSGKCPFCKEGNGTLLCDFIVAWNLLGEAFTCDSPVCAGCARRMEGRDICPKHAEGAVGVERPGLTAGVKSEAEKLELYR